MFGFVSVLACRRYHVLTFNIQAQLVPQLIINYKLKVRGFSRLCRVIGGLTWVQSVAHMPMKAMIYKTLSTVVDDFFAYVLLC